MENRTKIYVNDIFILENENSKRKEFHMKLSLHIENKRRKKKTKFHVSKTLIYRQIHQK